jgi:hypothetical protein
MSLSSQTLASWVRILFEAQTSARVSSVLVLYGAVRPCDRTDHPSNESCCLEDPWEEARGPNTKDIIIIIIIINFLHLKIVLIFNKIKSPRKTSIEGLHYLGQLS